MLEVTTSGGESGCLTLPAPHLLMVIGQANKQSPNLGDLNQ